MRLPSVRAVVGNVAGLGVLGAAGGAFGNPIITLPSSLLALVTLSGSNFAGWLVTLSTFVPGTPLSRINILPSSVFDLLPATHGYIPCVVDTVSSDVCWPSVSSAVQAVVITAQNSQHTGSLPIPEPNGIALLAIAVAAIAFALARWRSRPGSAPR